MCMVHVYTCTGIYAGLFRIYTLIYYVHIYMYMYIVDVHVYAVHVCMYNHEVLYIMTCDNN